MERLETVTDDQGWFQFPAWGRKPLPADVPYNAAMTYSSPLLTIFKSGYIKDLSNGSGKPSTDSAIKSEWDGKIIELKRLSGAPWSSYELKVAYLLRDIQRENGCIWKKMPRMAVAVDQEAKRLDGENVVQEYKKMRDNGMDGYSANCGSFQEFLLSYKK